MPEIPYWENVDMQLRLPHFKHPLRGSRVGVCGIQDAQEGIVSSTAIQAFELNFSFAPLVS
jgi:hypothetical protein